MAGLDSIRGSRNPKIIKPLNNGYSNTIQKYRILNMDLHKFFTFKKKNVIKSYVIQDSFRLSTRWFKYVKSNASLIPNRGSHKLALSITQRSGSLLLKHTVLKNYLKYRNRLTRRKLKKIKKLKSNTKIRLANQYRLELLKSLVNLYGPE